MYVLLTIITTMARTVHHSITLLLCLLSILLLFTTAVMETGRGFSLELIPPFSERSPFYPGNLTRSQRLQWLAQSSATSVRWLESTILGANTTAFRPPMLEKNNDYVVSVDIGTGAGRQSQLLRFDTGSRLTWIQCEPCSPCFPGPKFRSSDSPTYRVIPSSSPRCTHQYNSGPNVPCVYQITYEEGSSSSGVLSTETFTFQSDRSGQPEAFPRLTFGCSHSNNFPIKNSDWTGIMGMSGSPDSIAWKLGGRTGQFSYCLVKPDSGASSFLRFGNDYQIERQSRFQKMGFIIFRDNGHYYLTLNDVTIGGHRFHFEQGYFARREVDGTRGCILDTGTSVSLMVRPAYDRVTEYLKGRFSRQRLKRISARMCNPHMRHCFALPAGNLADALPAMTLHFIGADLQIGWEGTYMVIEDRRCFCFAVLPHNHLTIVGAHQQADTRFVFDVKSRALWFAPEDCQHDGHHS